MHANDYQQAALRTATPGQEASERLLAAALGLCGEAGEFADSLKKARFQGHPLDTAHLAEELGDLLWYAALACDALNLNIAEVMEQNIAKLQRRYPEGFSSERSQQREE
ncbi:MAG: nucleoside triphosphate pyrophosphohydrolase family protein [Chloroflexaceae bacterium]|jgi:NTP pyrophosphatase (non-canonical NTP hydrolase)|nr:nucleoside triphosphate pyrophosphohydrolase family protein [Chloroflexaceae bacterium]